MNKGEYNLEQMKRMEKKVEFLDNPEKRGDIPPEKLLHMLPLNKEDTILDLGAGTGYFTIPFAKKNLEGSVYALDIDADMLEIVNVKAKKENLTNIKTLKGSIDEIPLNDHSIDLVLASLVLHEVKSLSYSLQQIKRVLKPDGIFVCIEFEKKDRSLHKHPRVSSVTMEQEMKTAGLKVTKILSPTNDIYIIFAKKK